VKEDLKTAIRKCFNDFKPSTWKKGPRRIRGKIKFEQKMEGSIQITSN
jgi:hypothetical protein